MFRKRSSTVLLGLLLCAASAAAQVNVTLQLPFAQMPARVAEWRENESLIRIVVQNTGREQYEGLMLSVELSKDGRRIARSRNGHPAQPRFSLRPGETRSLSWREVISEEAVEYDGSIRQQVAATGELPEGQYRLCVQVLNAQLRPISPQPCGSFGIVLADPPVLVSPIGGAQASPMPLLQWRPSNPPAPGLQYRVTVKVRYRGQTLAQAMASNPVRLQATVPTTSYQVTFAQQLGADAADPNYAGHVWQVQALLNGRPYGRNRGLSQIEWFVVPPIAVDPVKPSGGRPIAVVEWEVPYEEIRPGRPIKLQVPPIQEDTVLYVLRVRVPEKLSLQQLEQLRKNWAHEVRKEISAMRTHQDTLIIITYDYPWEFARLMQDTAGAGVDRTRYTGGYFLYALPQDTTKPAELVDYYVPNGTSQDTAGVQGVYPGGYFLYSLPQGTTQPARLAGWVGRRDPVILGLPLDTVVPTPPPLPARMDAILVMGQFIPTHVGLPMPELVIDPGDGPVCGIPEPLGQGEETVGSTARLTADGPGGTRPRGLYSPIILIPPCACGPAYVCPKHHPRGRNTIWARQAPPQGGNQNMGQAIRQQLAELGAEVEVHRMAGPISLPRPSDVGIPEFRMMPPGGGAPVLWPNGNPPRDPDWPWVGVIGTPVLEGIEGEPGPGKPQNWCGTEYIWTGPSPKSPKELILTPVIPRPR
jgi:hypothetical protein